MSNNQIHEFYGFHQFSLFHPINSISYQWRISPTFPTLGEYLPDEGGEVMRSVCWGQTVDSGATGASNLVMQPLGPRGSFLKHEVQDSDNLKTWYKKHGKLTWKVLCPHQMLHLQKKCICSVGFEYSAFILLCWIFFTALHWVVDPLVPRLISRLLNLVFSTPHCTASSTLQQCNKRVFQEIFARDAQYFLRCSAPVNLRLYGVLHQNSHS